MSKATLLIAALGSLLCAGRFTQAQVVPNPGSASTQLWIQKSFVLAGEPDLDLFGEDELGAISTMMIKQPFCERVARSQRLARLQGWNEADAARRIAEGLTVKRAADSKQPILLLTFQGPDRIQAAAVLQAVADELPGFLNDARQSAWLAMLRNQDNVRKQTDAELKKLEGQWLELLQKSPIELVTGNLETRQAALALSDRELAARAHELAVHIESLKQIQKGSNDPAVTRLAFNDWRARNNILPAEKEVTPDQLLKMLHLEREGIQHGRTVNNQEYKKVQEQLLASASTLSAATQVRTQLEIARSLANEAALKSMALASRRESLPTYQVTVLTRAE